MLKLIILCLAVYSLACLLLYFKQRDMLYFPTPTSQRGDAEVLWLETDESRLKIWRLNQGKEAVLYFGGNAEAVENNIDLFGPLLPDYSVYLNNYRGYGGSSGQPTETALINDALALFDRIKSKYQRVHVIGRSLGSGVAVQLAAQREVAKLVLITPYDSIERVAAGHYPIFPVRWLIKDRFNSTDYVGQLDNQILVLIAGRDKVIPNPHSISLVNAAKHARVELLKLEQAEHNNILDFDRSRLRIRDFLANNRLNAEH